MRAALVVVFVLGACWSSSPPPTIASSAPPASTSAPSIAWGERDFITRRLPAIAADGSIVVLAIADPDGARGNPNLRLEVRTRDDRVQWSQVVLSVQEVDAGAAFFDETGVLAPLRDRIARANDELARLAVRHRLAPLRKMEVENDEESPITNQRLRGGNIVVSVRNDHLVLHEEQGPQVLSSIAIPSSWRAPPRKSHTVTCSNPLYLDESWVATEHRLAVVTISYEGTDLCWEPDPQLHVVRW